MSLSNNQTPPPKTGTEFKDKLATLGRMAMTGSGVALSLFAIVGVFNAQQVTDATPILKKLLEDIQAVASDFSALWAILGVSLVAAAAKLGLSAASISGKLRSITTNKAVDVQGQIVVSKTVADQVPSDKVVSK